jgi:molecular chaperone HtpG
MGRGSREKRGTDIVLQVTEEEQDYLKAETVRRVLDTYCAFMPVPIYLTVIGETVGEAPINDPAPLWLKAPSECTEEEYREFYKKVFHDERDPLFYIHINADFPLNFKGILYFPKLQDEYASLEGQVKLYYNQVFVADNIKEVIPEYMMLLRGVLDCPELPLNVSRSYLQNSGYVAKISNHITKKICDKFTGLFNTDREKLESFWDDVKPFVEYGCTRDEKFFDRIKDVVLYKTTDGEYLTASEYLEKNKGKGQENTVYYASDVLQQVGYIDLFREQEITVAVMDGMIDSRFLSFLEMKDHTVHFVRIDSDLDQVLKSEDQAEENEELLELFRQVVPESVKVTQELMKSTKTPALLTLSEEKRRLGEILKQYGNTIPGLSLPEDEITLTVNMNCPLIARIATLCAEESSREKAKKLARQVYMIAVVSQRSFTQEELQEFISSSIDLLYNA